MSLIYCLRVLLQSMGCTTQGLLMLSMLEKTADACNFALLLLTQTYDASKALLIKAA